MVSNAKLTGRAVALPKGLLLGATWSMVILVVLSAVSAHMIATQILPQESIGYCAMASLFAAACSGGMVCAGKMKIKPFYCASLNGASLYLLLILATALFFGGQYQGMGVTFFVVAAGSLAAGSLVNSRRKRKQGRRRKKTYR